MITTYQHDYVPPFSRRYEFLMKGASTDSELKKCDCPGALVVVAPCQQGGLGWTSHAQTGHLADARIYPSRLTAEQIENLAFDANIDCFRDQPNRFLKTIRTAYPELYERLKNMPRNELNRHMDSESLFSTYQIDFCSVEEFPQGVYESLAKEKSTSKLNARKLLMEEGPCDEFINNIQKGLDQDELEGYRPGKDPCEKAYKPFKVTLTDSSRFITSGDNSHWRANIFKKHISFSEYLQAITKAGCIITRDQINGLSKCSGANHCRHQLKQKCADFK